LDGFKVNDDSDDRDAPASGRTITAEHLAELAKSGLTEHTARANGVYSERDPRAVAGLLGWKRPAAGLGACLVFPYRAADGTVNGYARLKPANPRQDRKNAGKRIKYEAPVGKPNRAYFPHSTFPVFGDASVPLLITEGEKKSLAADQHGFPCVGLSGVWAWCKKRKQKGDKWELIDDLARIMWSGRPVFIVFDSDAAQNENTPFAEYHLAQTLGKCGATVRVVRLPGGDGPAKVGLDDYLLTHTGDDLCKLLDAATQPAKPERKDDRPVIKIGTDEYRVNEEAVKALAGETDLYQRGGILVHIGTTDDEDAHAAVRRPSGVPVVRPLAPSLLRERLTRCARWVKLRPATEDRDEEERDAHPPEWSVSAVYSRTHWSGVRHLETVVNHPVVLPDGSLLAANGYDRASRLLVNLPPDLRLSVPDRPGRHAARSAVAAIDEVLSDFPFEKPEHRAAWFAGLLTPLAWFAFSGPAPMLLIDANTRGAGKGLLSDVIALTLTGRRFPVMSYTSDKEELRKKITSLAMEGERLVLLDNLAGAVGNDVLDTALTAETWKDRVLGVNKVFDGPLHVAWYATGNNVQLAADTARRCSHCRLETMEERPELRTDVRHADLRGHVREHRGELLSAAVTILRAWFAAGKPRHGLVPWGSFEPWSSVVREAVVFAGLPDPGETRLALQTAADRDANAMLALIASMERMDVEKRGVTAAEIVEAARKYDQTAEQWVVEMRSAVEELAGRLDGRTLAYKLRHFARRNFGGKMIDRATVCGQGGIVRWVVRSAARLPAAAGTSPPSPPSPPQPSGGDGGDGGDVSPLAGNCAGVRPDPITDPDEFEAWAIRHEGHGLFANERDMVPD
jgi:hypothetical protein